MIGYLLEQALLQRDPSLRVVTLVTQTVVAEDDVAFLSPSKPIGPMYDGATAQKLADTRGFAVARDGKGWRRVVASPEPLALLESDAVRCLVDRGFLVVASGGGGMPVALDSAGRPRGIEAVVDKDLAAVVLAGAVKAERLLLLTDVDGVYDGFGTESARRLDTLSPTEARALAESGALGSGSMLPKVEAAARFAERGGIAVVAALADAAEALAGRAGTTIAVWPTSAPSWAIRRRAENPQVRFSGSADVATSPDRDARLNDCQPEGAVMKIDSKDRNVFGLAILAVAVFVTTYAGWGVPLIAIATAGRLPSSSCWAWPPAC